jgi:formylglycine-generating enzyme required for sulfatase activity
MKKLFLVAPIFALLLSLYTGGASGASVPQHELVQIPAGNFRMGSNEKSREKPIHTVQIKAFKMMAKEVTFKQYDIYAKAEGKSLPGDEGWGRGNRPVINVSWKDTRQYIKWLNQKTGKQFRLPTEAEWEYAGRGGSTTKYSWGNNVKCSKAQYDGGKDSSCYYKDSDGLFRGTATVGSFAANAFGLYDMHGNVWELTQDCWNDSYNGAPTNGKAWLSGDCGKRVLRGGGWYSYTQYMRSASRIRYTTTTRLSNYGFRLAQD